ncbi:MAG: EpsI family protein [Alphaproteobacteria bacterium PA4]|nr:MAG: EpsI family protein [Alphaproteobacteria bacterium PA4]
MNRRDLLMGGGLLVAAGGAAALQPRNRLVLLGDRNLEDVVPERIGNWQYVKSDALVVPKAKGSLADRLYSQTLIRLYQSPNSIPMMLLIAYGKVQNDLLQLHRPEVCYTAVGFTISRSEATQMQLAPGVSLPVRDLTARSDSRVEPITYWTRIGDDLPTSGEEQRWVKLRQQMHGYLSDGILVRISTLVEPAPEVFREIAVFARTLIKAMAPADRAVLIGRPLAAEVNR